VPKPIILLEGIGIGGNGALIRISEHSEQMINISYFYNLLGSMGNRRQLSTCEFIYRDHAGAHRTMLIFACLPRVITLVFTQCRRTVGQTERP